MMWPIFWPDDTDFTNPANTRHPVEDFNADGAYFAGQIAAVVGATGTSDDPSAVRSTSRLAWHRRAAAEVTVLRFVLVPRLA